MHPSTTDADLANGGTDLALPVGRLCSDPRADAYALPVTKASVAGHYTVALVASEPSPPIIGTDTWVVTITDAAGGAVDGATISAKPWMPDHGHGTSVTPSVLATAIAGQYTVAPLYLFMAGLWQVTLTIQHAGVTDEVVYTLCLADP